MLLINDIEFTAFVVFAIPIMYYDIKEKRIPDILLCLCFIVILVIRVLITKNFSFWNLLETLIGFTFIWLFWLFSKGKIGLGDAKFSALICLLLGLWGWILAIFLASFSGLLVAFIRIRFGKMAEKEAIPFAPFLSLGSIASYFLKYYLNDLLNNYNFNI